MTGMRVRVGGREVMGNLLRKDPLEARRRLGMRIRIKIRRGLSKRGLMFLIGLIRVIAISRQMGLVARRSRGSSSSI
jgi:hypothetical protein